MMTPAILALALILGPSAEEYRQQLQELEKKLAQTRQELQQLSQRERNTRQELRLLNKEIRTLESILAVLQKQERQAKARLQEVNRRIHQGNQRLGQWYNLYRQQVAHAAVQARLDTLPGHLQVTQRNLILYSAEVVDFYKGELKTLRQLKDQREQVWERLRTLQQQYQQRKRELVRVKRQRKRLLASLQRKKAAKQEEEQRLLETRRRLEQMIRQLAQEQRQRRQRRNLPTRQVKRGDLIWPARGKILSRFGMEREPRYGTKTKNNGIDLLLKPGAEVRAAADGVVVFAGPFMAYGNTVILDHGGDMTVYAYLGEIQVQVDQQVRQGQVIGRMPAHNPIFHFELRKGGRAVDPLKYLP